MQQAACSTGDNSVRKNTMAGTSRDYIAFVMERLAPLPDITSKRFFGGIGLSCNGVQFAMIMGNSLYFVVNQTTRTRYEKMGSTCFRYDTKKGTVEVKKYYEVPADCMDDDASLLELAREAIIISHKPAG
jgi:DNA transformation protein and related proteins